VCVCVCVGVCVCVCVCVYAVLMYVVYSEVCHPRCAFKLYGKVNSVKKYNYKLWRLLARKNCRYSPKHVVLPC